LERKTLDLSAKLGDFAIKRQATWGMSGADIVSVQKTVTLRCIISNLEKRKKCQR
jgi:hypothetical protein